MTDKLLEALAKAACFQTVDNGHYRLVFSFGKEKNAQDEMQHAVEALREANTSYFEKREEEKRITKRSPQEKAYEKSEIKFAVHPGAEMHLKLLMRQAFMAGWDAHENDNPIANSRTVTFGYGREEINNYITGKLIKVARMATNSMVNGKSTCTPAWFEEETKILIEGILSRMHFTLKTD